MSESAASPEATALVTALLEGSDEWHYHYRQWTGCMDGSETPPAKAMIDEPKQALLEYIAQLEAGRAQNVT